MFQSLRLIIAGWSLVVPAAVLGLLCFLLPTSIAHSECNSWISCGLNGLRGEAVFKEISAFEKQKSDEILSRFAGNDQEIIQRLTAYRQSVAQGSYRQTLRLCWAYRQALGYENPHGNSSGIENFNSEDSLKAWGEIYAQGLYQSVDGIVGLKSDYIQVAGVGFFDFESWFKSMYTLNFVTSSGFMYGAAHCLNTVNARQIQKFASAILIVDYEGSLASQIGINWSLAKLIGLVVSPLSRWVLHPLRATFESIVTKIGKPRLIIASVPLGIVLGDNFLCRMARMEAATENIKSILAQPSDNKKSTRIQKALIVANAYRKVAIACRGLAVNSPDCPKASKAFYDKVHETQFDTGIAEFMRDRQDGLDQREFKIANSRNPELARKLYSCDGLPKVPVKVSNDLQQAYLDILDILIPVVQKTLGQSASL